MEKNLKLDTPFLLQRLVLVLFLLFPITLSIFSQILLVIHSWDFIKFIKFGFLVTFFLLPIFAILAKDSIWEAIEQFKHLPLIWVVGLAIILRIIFVQLISTNFASDMEDVHFLAVDISSGHPLANLDKYPNIPSATHLDMSALVLSYVYRLFGASTSTAKLFLILLGGLTTFLIYLVGQEVANKRVGFLAAFLFATLPSVICYTGVLAGDHLALPPMILAILIYARTYKLDYSKFFPLILTYAIIGILAGFGDWFRPLGTILVTAFIVSTLIYSVGKRKLYRLLTVLSVLLFAYTATSNLAVKISEDIFQTKILSSSQRIGEFILKGLNPDSKGLVTFEDDNTARQTYERFGNDSLGAQKYLINLALSRLDPKKALKLFEEKFTLIWASHDALFDYSLIGSNDQELVNLMRAFETLLYLVITIFIFFQAIVSIRHRSHPAVFVMQLFIFGFAVLLLLTEVQNRYVMIVIPFSILLGVLGMKDAFSKEAKSSSLPS
jgi:4-amino-4-deoxy-L-arabinose transferase-like glycosyltransferase